MNSIEGKQTVEISSKRNLIVASLAAVAGAMALLVTVILPAEYGVDPLGTGAALGLLPLSGIVVEDQSSTFMAESLTPTMEGPVGYYGAKYNFDTAEFVLEPYEYVEYKYHLQAGATMLYSWSSSATVIHDFHGDPDDNPTAVQSYDMRNRSSGFGEFKAPFSGIHGWLWENPGGDRIIVKVTTAGFYPWAQEFRYDGSGERHEVVPLESVAPNVN